jgi:uncharacterized membrane protein YphA (DoxX/SURF4 family)
LNPITSYRGDRLRVRLAALLDVSRAALRVAAPVVDLLIRLSLAKAFFAPGMLPGSSVANFHAAWPMIIAQIVGPLLLAVGFWVRPVALVMLLLTLLAQSSGAPQDEHLFWAALFGWYVVHGAGPLSLDHVLNKGLGRSALPFASLAMAAGAWISREIGPLYLLALRLWLATALAGPALAPATLPTMGAGMAFRPLAAVCGALLALGLATPVVVAILFAVGSGMAMAGADKGMTIYGPLLLILLGVSGGGRYLLDYWIVQWAHRSLPPAEDAPHIVIVGAGFGGMACAAGLRHEPAQVTLIDLHNYHLFQPLLYQVATASLSPADVATPIRAAFRDDAKLRVLCGTVTAVDTTARRIIVDGQAVAYDALVLATGATHGYFGHEEWAAYAPGLKSLSDATSIRSRILDAFEQAEATQNPITRQHLLTFLICGAGPTGVEMAGAIAELARNGMAKDFRNFDPASARILLIQAGPRVLPQFNERLSRFARTSLEALGVDVRGRQPGRTHRRGWRGGERRTYRRRHGLMGGRRGRLAHRRMARNRSRCSGSHQGRARSVRPRLSRCLCDRRYGVGARLERPTCSRSGPGGETGGRLRSLRAAGATARPQTTASIPLSTSGQFGHHRTEERGRRFRTGKALRTGGMVAMGRRACLVPGRSAQPALGDARLGLVVFHVRRRGPADYRSGNSALSSKGGQR